MSKRQWLMILGAVVVILPFAGFPSSWDSAISLALGVIIIAVAYRMGGNINRDISKDISPNEE